MLVGGAVPNVVMCHCASAPFFQRQARLGAIERLHLALLVTAEHQRVFGSIQIEANDILQLLGKAWVIGNLESADQVRLEPMSLPDASHGATAYVQHARQRTLTPVRGRRWLPAQGALHNETIHFRAIDRLSPAPGGIMLKACAPSLPKADAPPRRLLPGNPKGSRDLLIVLSFDGEQDDLASLRQ